MSSNLIKRNAARNIQASAYAVAAATGELKAMHYSTSGAGGTFGFFPSTDDALTSAGAGWWV